MSDENVVIRVDFKPGYDSAFIKKVKFKCFKSLHETVLQAAADDNIGTVHGVRLVYKFEGEEFNLASDNDLALAYELLGTASPLQVFVKVPSLLENTYRTVSSLVFCDCR